MKGGAEKRRGRASERRAAARRRPSRSQGARARAKTQDWEKLLTGLAGAFLAFDGLRRKNVGGVGMALVGGGLMYRGLSGHLPLNEAAEITMQMINSQKNGHAGRVLAGLQRLVQRSQGERGKAERNRAA